MTNAKIMRRLLWKDYRLQRMFWICMGALGILLQFLGFTVREASPVDQLTWLFGVSACLPAFYALGCGATMFAGERETGTFEFQRGLPVSAKRFFWNNVLFGAISTAAMIAVLFLSALCFAAFSIWLAGAQFPELPERFWDLFFFGFFGIAALELFIWGAFFSLIMKRPLVAAMLGVAAASVCLQLVMHGNLAVYFTSPYIDARIVRLLIVLAVAVIDVVLGYRWFLEEGVLARILGVWERYRKPSASAAVALPASAKSRYGFFTAFVRLAWQQARNCLWLWSGYFLILLVVILVVPFIDKQMAGWKDTFAFCIFAAIIFLPLLGVYAFYHDQQRRSFLFLTERGVRPSYVWWSRQLAGLSVPLVLGLIFYAAFIIPSNRHNDFIFLPFWELVQVKTRHISPNSYLYFLQFIVFFYHILVIYAAGQLCAMFIRSGIVAGFCTWGLTVGILAWTWLMFFWHVPWWSVAPWPFLMLLLTWLRTPTWMLERRSFRSALRRSAVLLPALAIVVAVPFYRVFSVPLVDPGFSPDEFVRSLKPTPAALETVAMYKKAYLMGKIIDKKIEPPKKIEPWMVGEPDDRPPEPWKPFEPQPPENIEAVNANQFSIALTLEASRRAECDFNGDYPFDRENRLAASDTAYLGHLLIWRAKQLEGEGQLDAAWEHYLGALRVVRHLDYHAPFGVWNYDNLVQYVYRNLAEWAARPGQTPERIRSAIDALRDFPSTTNQLAYVCKHEYLRCRGILEGDKRYIEDQDPSVTNRYRGVAKTREFDSLKFWERTVPWERYRALRLLNVITREQIGEIENRSERLERGDTVVFDSERWPEEPPFALWDELILPTRIQLWKHSSSWRFDGYVMNVTKCRAARILLALEAWKMEHGKLPDSLDNLAGKYFENVPVDPFSGKAFRYFPGGLPDRLTKIEPWAIYRSASDSPIYLEAKQPLLWSVGYRLRETNSELPTLSRYLINDALRQVLRSADSEAEIWQKGVIFPIP
jgi:hypothetical protein